MLNSKKKSDIDEETYVPLVNDLLKQSVVSSYTEDRKYIKTYVP
jgi:hypothetical protein